MAKKFYDIEKTRAYFDRFGSLLVIPNAIDRPVYRKLLARGGFDESRRVLELGSGRGIFARLFFELADSAATIVVTEISPRLRRRLAKNLAAFDQRVQILGDAGPQYSFSSESFDRVVACFVLDMMDESDQRAYLLEAHRLLAEGGSLCVMTVTDGVDLASRCLMRVGKALAKLHPWLTLGARYRRITHLLDESLWNIDVNETVVRMGCATQLTIARKKAVTSP